MTNKKVLRIGNAGGYWGDDPQALARQVEMGQLDYVTMDFLAEVTMSILKKQQARNPDRGFAYDLIGMLEPVLPTMLKKGTRLITNAGGIHPKGCAKAIYELAQRIGVDVKIAVVYGDDIVEQLQPLKDSGAKFTNMETNQQFSDVEDKILAANIYFGATPVVQALKTWEPDIIITGRVTDTGITLAPMIHEFGWALNDWDRLASGIVAGHLMECGSQATGGNFTDWEKVTDFGNIGYPVVEVSQDGAFVLTKHDGTGGLVSEDTAREQLFYEMGHPQAYITPDVVADFSSIQVTADGPDRVRVSGVKGSEPTSSYKVSMAFEDGYKAIGSIVISGPNARPKAEKFADIFWNKWDHSLTERSTEFLGWNALHRSLGGQEDGNEILLRLGARSESKETLQAFGKLIPSLILSGPPGVAAIGGVAKPQGVISYWPALIDKSLVQPKIALLHPNQESQEIVCQHIDGAFEAGPGDFQECLSATRTIPEVLHADPSFHCLMDICIARSGDKGDTANIGLCARSPEAYAYIKEHITAERVKNWFQELCHGRVVRYALDNLRGLNFLLENSLGGGGSCTLRTDAQGKTFAHALLRQRVNIPQGVIDSVSKQNR